MHRNEIKHRGLRMKKKKYAPRKDVYKKRD
jgi:hypothetical protein